MIRDRVNSFAGWLPVAMSAAAFLLVLAVLVTGWERNLKDEGAAAHLWQLLIVLQAPLILAYLATAPWANTRRVLAVVAVQTGALVLAFAPVAIFRL